MAAIHQSTCGVLDLASTKLNLSTLGEFKPGEKPYTYDSLLKVDRRAFIGVAALRKLENAFQPSVIEQTFETVRLKPEEFALIMPHHMDLAKHIRNALEKVKVIADTYFKESEEVYLPAQAESKKNTATKLMAIYDTYNEALKNQIEIWEEKKQQKNLSFKAKMAKFAQQSQQKKTSLPSAKIKKMTVTQPILSGGQKKPTEHVKESRPRRKKRLINARIMPFKSTDKGGESSSSIERKMGNDPISFLCQQAEKRFKKLIEQKSGEASTSKPWVPSRLKNAMKGESEGSDKGKQEKCTSIVEEIAQKAEKIQLSTKNFDENMIFQEMRRRREEDPKPEQSIFNQKLLERTETFCEKNDSIGSSGEWDEDDCVLMTEFADVNAVGKGKKEWVALPGSKRRRSVSLSSSKTSVAMRRDFVEEKEEKEKREKEKIEMEKAAEMFRQRISNIRTATEYTNSEDAITDIEDGWSEAEDEALS